MRLATLIHNFLPLLTTSRNHISTLIFSSSAFRPESKPGLLLSKRKCTAGETAILSSKCTAQRQRPQNPRTCQGAICASHFLRARTRSYPRSLLPAPGMEQTQNAIWEKGGSTSGSSLTPKPIWTNQAHPAWDRYTEWACWMVGGNVTEVTEGPGGTGWLRCSASKLNTDRKPRVWYCKKKKSFVFLPELGLQTKEAVLILKEILQQWERKEWNSVATRSPRLPRLESRLAADSWRSAVNTHRWQPASDGPLLCWTTPAGLWVRLVSRVLVSKLNRYHWCSYW